MFTIQVQTGNVEDMETVFRVIAKCNNIISESKLTNLALAVVYSSLAQQGKYFDDIAKAQITGVSINVTE